MGLRMLRLTGAVQALSRAWHAGKAGQSTVAAPVLATFGIDSARQNSRPRRGTPELLKSYSESPWMRAIAKRVGEATAQVEWQVYRETGRSAVPGSIAARVARLPYDKGRAGALRKLVSSGALQEIETHPVLDFLRYGSPFLDGVQCRTLAQIQYDLTGEAFALIERAGEGGQPSGWYNLPPHWVKATPHPSGRNWFEVQPPGVGKPVRIERENMLWMRDPDVRDPYGRGSGIGTALADEIDTDEFIAKFLKSSFVNDAQPPFIVFGDGVTPEVTERLEQAWYEKVGGFFKRGRPLFLNRKVEVHELGRTFQELQLIELRKWQRDVSFTVWGVSPEWFGVIENSNRATIDAADYMVESHVVVPRATMQSAALNQQLMPMYGDETIVLGFRSPIPADQDHRRQVFAMSPWAFRIDEHRDLAGEMPLEGGKGELFPSPLSLSATEDPLGIDVLAAQAEEEEEVDEEGEGEEQEPDEAEEEDEDEDDDEDDEKSSSAQQRHKGPDDRPILTPGQVEVVVRAAKDELFGKAVRPAIGEVVRQFGEATSVRFGVQWNESDPRVLSFLRQQSSTQIVRIGKTTRYKIRRALEAGIREGDSYEDLARRVNDAFRSAKAYRARAIARTESVRAANFGVHEGFKQAGVLKKEWLAAKGDDRTREAHLNLDGVVLAIDEPFVSSTTGGTGQRPGDFPDAVDVVNCRCTLLAVVDDERREASTPLAKLLAFKRHEASRAAAEGLIVRAARRGFTQQEAAVRRALQEVRS